MKKVAFKTLGCRLNLYETDALASQFYEGEYEIVDFSDKADIYIINTCTVTNQSDQKSRQIISQTRKKNEKALVLVTGCMVNNKKQALLDSKIIDYIVDNERKSSIFSIIESHFREEQTDPEGFDKDLFSYAPAFKTFHTRSLIKIQDGCNNFCSYCIIPMVRGRATSRPSKDIINNVIEVLNHGFKEVVLTGVNIGKYKDDDLDFEHLIAEILKIEGDFRLRISSIEPDDFSEQFIDLFKNQKLAPHLHICLQSGADNTLKQMHRMYTAKEFRDVCERFRKAIPEFNLTTDIIVGFPGETDADFEECVKMAKELNFSHIHTFKYSIRSGTRAEKMPNQVSEKIKNQRSAVIRAISDENRLRYLKMMQGKPQRMLIERILSDGTALGYGEHYIPLRLKAANLQRNTFVDVTINGIYKEDEIEGLAEIQLKKK